MPKTSSRFIKFNGTWVYIYIQVKDPFYNQQFTCSIIVCYDNSTVEIYLKHCWEEKVKEGKMTIDKWPKAKQTNQIWQWTSTAGYSRTELSGRL